MMFSIRNWFVNGKGFIMADVMLAMLLLSIAILPIARLFTQAMGVDRLAQHYTVATNLAQQQLELLKTQPPAYWRNPTLFIPWQDSWHPVPATYQLTTHSGPLPDESLVQVTVTITWQEGGNDYSLQFITWYPTV